MVARIYKKTDIDRLYADVVTNCKKWLMKKNTSTIDKDTILIFIANHFTTLYGMNWTRTIIDGLCDEMEELRMIESICYMNEDNYYMIDDSFD